MLQRLATKVTTHLVLENLSKSIGYSLSKLMWKVINDQYRVVTQRSWSLKSLHSKCLKIAVRYWNCIRISWCEWRWESHSPPTRTLRAFTNIESSQAVCPEWKPTALLPSVGNTHYWNTMHCPLTSLNNVSHAYQIRLFVKTIVIIIYVTVY